MIGIVTVALAVILAASVPEAGSGVRGLRLAAACIVLVMGMLAAAIIAPRGAGFWVVAGIPYAGMVGLAPDILRTDIDLGFVAILFLFAVVWSTDIAAYFAGRAVGGPKLAPRLSPKKTWSGCIGGAVGAVAVAPLVVQISGIGSLFAVAVLAFALSVSAQAGDLFESALKRRFGAKDSSNLIPGHGGLMDRLDSFVAAAVLACIIGVVRGGVDAPAHGLLIW
jgi:phosphatidate cytidylyltransferase